MCGRFTLTLDADQIQAEFPWVAVPQVEIAPRYNVAPTHPVAVVINEKPFQLDYYLWGLIPSWAKDVSIASRLINARAETLAEKPAFRAAYRRRRCLILADGFYEWQVVPGRKSKQPMYVHLKSSQAFAFAGLWEMWQAPDGSEARSCTIITTQPNELMTPIHNRMPVILPPAVYPLWLAAGEQPAAALQPLLKPYPAQEMEARPVSNAVNNPQYDDAACIV